MTSREYVITKKKYNIIEKTDTCIIFFFKAKIYATDDLIFKSRVLHLERYMCIKKKGEVVLTNFKLAVKILLKNKNSLKKKKTTNYACNFEI